MPFINLLWVPNLLWGTFVRSGDRLPLGAPALMMSPQGVNRGMVRPDLIRKRDEKYKVCSEELRTSRAEIEEPICMSPQADYWKQSAKGFAIDVRQTDMKNVRAPYP